MPPVILNQKKIFNIKNITSKQTNKQKSRHLKNKANSEIKTDAAVPHYYYHNFLYFVSNLENNLMNFFYYFSAIIIRLYVFIYCYSQLLLLTTSLNKQLTQVKSSVSMGSPHFHYTFHKN